MLYRKKILVLAVLFLVIISKTVQPAIAQTKLVILGHLYPIMADAKVLQSLVNKIDALSPDFVALLGDSNLHKSETVEFWNKKFGHKMLYSPGNNEVIDGSISKYIENVGYLNKVFETPDCRIIILNSLAGKSEIREFLAKIPAKDPLKKSLILTHHRIWDDTLTSAKPNQHDKSYFFADIFTEVQNTADLIFAGNSKRQYFSDFTATEGSQNVNNIFWADNVSDLTGYSIGTGDGYPKVGFVAVTFNELLTEVKPLHILTALKEPIPVSYLTINENSVMPNNQKPPGGSTLSAQEMAIDLFNLIRSSVFSFILGLLCGCCLILLAQRKKRRKA